MLQGVSEAFTSPPMSTGLENVRPPSSEAATIGRRG